MGVGATRASAYVAAAAAVAERAVLFTSLLLRFASFFFVRNMIELMLD